MNQPTRKPKPRVLIVDDEEQNLTIFRGTFRRELKVFTANSAQDALALLERETEPIPVIISDQRMPLMTGVEFLVKVREQWPESIRMVLTAYTDVDAIIDAINLGNVYKFIYKPWDRDELLQTILHAAETYELRRRNQKLTEELLRQERLATVGRLVSGLAHEIGNQLTAETLSNILLKRYGHDEFLSEKIKVIRNSFTMIHNMVKEIRDFTRQNNRNLELSEKRLAETVQDTIGLLLYDRDVRRCAVETTLDDEVGAMVHTDKIQQVLINLIKNAAQSIPSGRAGKIHIEVTKTGEEALLRVTDNGEGVPEELRHRIWEPFFTTKKEVGTGLGLDICRQIVEAHGGKIRLDSTPGRGSTFEVAVPAAGPSEDGDQD